MWSYVHVWCRYEVIGIRAYRRRLCRIQLLIGLLSPRIPPMITNSPRNMVSLTGGDVRRLGVPDFVIAQLRATPVPRRSFYTA